MHEASEFRNNQVLDQHADRVQHQSQLIESTEGYLTKK
jgi:hypothetical protein